MYLSHYECDTSHSGNESSSFSLCGRGANTSCKAIDVLRQRLQGRKKSGQEANFVRKYLVHQQESILHCMLQRQRLTYNYICGHPCSMKSNPTSHSALMHYCITINVSTIMDLAMATRMTSVFTELDTCMPISKLHTNTVWRLLF